MSSRIKSSLSKIFPATFRQKNFARKESLNATKPSFGEVKDMVKYERFADYTSAHDALRRSIIVSGVPQKEIASILWPRTQKIDTAKSLLSRALSPETDVKLNLEQILTIMRETRPEDFIYFLCDQFGFDRPKRKTKEDIRKEVEDEVKNINSTLSILLKKVSLLGDKD